MFLSFLLLLLLPLHFCGRLASYSTALRLRCIGSGRIWPQIALDGPCRGKADAAQSRNSESWTVSFRVFLEWGYGLRLAAPSHAMARSGNAMKEAKEGSQAKEKLGLMSRLNFLVSYCQPHENRQRSHSPSTTTYVKAVGSSPCLDHRHALLLLWSLSHPRSSIEIVYRR